MITAAVVKIRAAAWDMCLNVVAGLVPMVVLQFFILPLVAQSTSEDAYGVILASVALLGLIPSTAGNAINNVRLLRDSEYTGEGVRGDYSLIVAVACAVSSIAVCAGSFVSGVSDPADLFAVSAASALLVIREYLTVEYRLKLKYNKILNASLWQALGYVVGFVAFAISGVWGFVYLWGYFASDLYIVRTTTVWKDPFAATSKLRSSLKDVASLGFANALSRATNYADRLILVPLAGSAVVAVYYVAGLFGKTLSLIVGPVNNVLLSYLVKKSRSSHHEFLVVFATGGVLCVVGYILTMAIAEPLISFLYPQYVDVAMAYVPVETAASYVMVLSNVINPFVMRFCDLRWQVVMNAAFCGLFFLGAIVGFFMAGVSGFCFGVLAANCIRLLLGIAIYMGRSSASSA